MPMEGLGEALYQAAYQEAYQAAYQEGLEIGRMTILNELIEEGHITVEDAAKAKGMTVEEFKKKMNEI